jgi:UDP-GlcNAc:undecaprenyl-phosphate GlcNAc-1-phosphate transferase
LGDIQIRSLAGVPLTPYVGVPLTILWLVASANAFNLIDGVDGLASGIGLIASVTMLAVGIVHGDSRLIMATAPLAGALLGFLIFNFNPASIFLGDCGSLWLGFMLGICAVIWSQKPATAPGAVAPLIALFIPLLDLGISTLRRFLRSDPIFRADRDHIHHRLLDRGLPQHRVALLLFAASGLAACFSLLECVAPSRVGGLGIVLFSTVAWVGIQELRYQEFGLAARLLWRNGLRRMVKSHLSLRRCEESLRLASNAEECWQAIRALSLEFGFYSAALRLSRRNYHEQTSSSLERCWMLHIPFSESEYVGFMCPLELSRDTKVIAPLAELLHRALSLKAAEFSSSVVIAPMPAVAATGTRSALTTYQVGEVPQL